LLKSLNISYIMITPLHLYGYFWLSRSSSGGRRGRDRMVVGFATTCAISAYHH